MITHIFWITHGKDVTFAIETSEDPLQSVAHVAAVLDWSPGHYVKIHGAGPSWDGEYSVGIDATKHFTYYLEKGTPSPQEDR